MSVNLQNLGQYQNASLTQKYASNMASRKEDGKNMAVRKNEKSEGPVSNVNLSDAAKELLKELQSTYGNMDFIVADYETDEEAQEYLLRGTKEYSVLLDPETLEAMAADESVKKEYISKLEDATVQLKDIASQLEESGENVTNLGISIKSDGTTTFFAQLEKVSEDRDKFTENMRQARKEAKEAQEEAIKERREAAAAKRAGKGEESAKAEKTQNAWDAGKASGVKKATVSADSVEELLEKIRNIDWDQIEASAPAVVGGKIDFTA